jgi:hypothetical protein
VDKILSVERVAPQSPPPGGSHRNTKLNPWIKYFSRWKEKVPEGQLAHHTFVMTGDEVKKADQVMKIQPSKNELNCYLCACHNARIWH